MSAQVLTEHWRIGDARANAIAANAIAGVVESDGFREADNRVFGSCISGSERLTNKTADRANIDYPTATCPAEVRQGVFEGEKHGFDIYVHQLIPLTFSVLMQRFDVNYSGVIDENVQRTELLDSLC